VKRKSAGAALLPTDRAFVIQFTAATDMQRRHIAGRVEHVVSGQSVHFKSLQGLLAFIAQTLQQNQGTGNT
jgi:hypothetical protein